MIDLDISKNKLRIRYEVRILDGDTIRLASDEEKDEILKKFEQRNEVLKDEELYFMEYGRLLDEKRNIYLSVLLGKKEEAYSIGS